MALTHKNIKKEVIAPSTFKINKYLKVKKNYLMKYRKSSVFGKKVMAF